MGDRGPIPQREAETERRNIPDVPLQTITVIGGVEVPELGIDDPHELVTDMYEAMKLSAQSRFYEPTDWQFARMTLFFANELLKYPNQRGSAQKLAAIQQMLTPLMLTEGERRRVRLEIERKPEGDDNAEVVQISDLYKQRLGAM